MNSTSLEEAIVWMAAGLGLDPHKDKEEVIGYVNKYRNLLYNSFDRIQLFDDYEQCFTVSTFHQDCHGSACGQYRGFTATLDMEGIVGSWVSFKPVMTRSRWREVHRGMDDPRGGALELIPVNGTFATERDMTGTYKLRVYAHSPKDADKHVKIIGKDALGERVTLDFKLAKDTQSVVQKFIKVIESVTLPADLCGAVDLYQEDGTLLSSYPPGITTPQYRRYKLHDSAVCESNTILVRSARRYLPITQDHEVVEVGDQLVIEAAGRYFKYGEDTLEPKEIRVAQTHLQTMYGYLDNMQSRRRGNEKKDTLVPTAKSPRKIRRRGLPGYRR